MSETIVTNKPQLSHVITWLFKGVVYYDRQPELWNSLLNFQAGVRDHVKMIGLELFIDEAEGYAFLRQKNDENNEEQQGQLAIPRLIQRRQLSFSISLLCLLLRKKLLEQDASGGDTRTFLTQEQIINMMEVFLPARVNEIKTNDQIESAINKVIELGFLRRLDGEDNRFEIRRIIKALIDANWLSNIEDKLREYQDYANNLT